MPAAMKDMFGYEWLFNTRREHIAVMWRAVKRKDRFLLGRRVKKVEERDEKVAVVTEGGEEFVGDVLVGADGVRSVVRQEMWRIGNEKVPGTFGEEEMDNLHVEFRGLYGWARGHPIHCDPEFGDFHCVLNNKRNFLAAPGPDGRLFFIACERLDRTYKAHEVPRYTEEDKKAFAERMADVPFNETYAWGDIWPHVVESALVPLEEAMFTTWQHGRILCIGDSVHKTTPNIGIGANVAIQGAAKAASVIKRFHDGRGQLNEYPGSFQPYVEASFKISARQTRAHVREGLVGNLLNKLVTPWGLDIVFSWGYQEFAKAAKIDFLPVPERSVGGWMKYHSGQIPDNIWIRMIVAAPFFLASGHLERNYVLYSIMLMEAARRNNALTFIAIPNLLLLALGKWALPFWFWNHFVFSAPMRRFLSADARQTNMAYTRAVVPITAIGLGVGPAWAAGAQLVVGKLSPEEMKRDAYTRPFRDVPWVRYTMSIVCTASLYQRLTEDIEWTPVVWASLAWMALVYADMVRGDMLDWWTLPLGALLTPLLGPNTVLAATWLHHEESLRTRRHKNAITKVEPVGDLKHTNGNGHAILGTGMNGHAKEVKMTNGHAQ